VVQSRSAGPYPESGRRRARGGLNPGRGHEGRRPEDPAKAEPACPRSRVCPPRMSADAKDLVPVRSAMGPKWMTVMATSGWELLHGGCGGSRRAISLRGTLNHFRTLSRCSSRRRSASVADIPLTPPWTSLSNPINQLREPTLRSRDPYLWANRRMRCRHRSSSPMAMR
jgi:hypothetical protein